MRQVSRRHVLYIPGFDPMPPRTYRERYRREAALQARYSGYEISVGRSEKGAKFGWHVDAVIEGGEVSTEAEVLYWADIVQGGMGAGVAGTYWQLARTAWIYISSGALFRLMRLRKGPIIAALYPVAVLLLQGLLAVAIAAVVYGLGKGVAERALEAIPLETPFPVFTPLAGLAALALAGVFIRWCARRDHFLAWYLMKDYAFSSSMRGAYPTQQEARMAVFADRIAEVLSSDVDEVLVVGHSSGAYIAVSVLADLGRTGRVAQDGPELSLLTLGQVVPMVSFLPEARRLRRDLAYMGGADVAWVDVTAPGDGCAFALCDPVAVSGVAPEGQKHPLILSAAFTKTLSPARRKALRWRLFEKHFQYLNAFDDLPEGADAYEYFRVTAGPVTLRDRFASRTPSRSRIVTRASGFTDT